VSNEISSQQVWHNNRGLHDSHRQMYCSGWKQKKASETLAIFVYLHKQQYWLPARTYPYVRAGKQACYWLAAGAAGATGATGTP